MNKILQHQIDSALTSSGCGMIGPSHKYFKDGENYTRKKIDWLPNNYLKLESSISKRMKELYLSSFVDILEDQKNIIYIDCKDKGSHDIMFYIFQQAINKLPSDQLQIAGKIINRHSTIASQDFDRNTYIIEHNLTLDRLYEYYQTQLNQRLEQIKDVSVYETLKNHESDLAYNALIKYMKIQNVNRMGLFLDNTSALTTQEQSRINAILYARGAMKSGMRVYTKINNGNQSRNTRRSSTGHGIQSTHDYDETRIYQKDVMTDVGE